MKKISALLGLALLSGSLAACGGNKGGEAEKTTQAQESAAGEETTQAQESAAGEERAQVLNASLDAEPDSLDLAKVSDMYSTTVVSQFIEGLTSLRVDATGKEVVEPAMAETWEASEDQLTWTFHLRDAQWEDGVPVTADDFEYAIKRILNPETASPISGNILFIKNAEEVVSGNLPVDEAGIKAIDDKTLEIQLAYPAP